MASSVIIIFIKINDGIKQEDLQDLLAPADSHLSYALEAAPGKHQQLGSV